MAKTTYSISQLRRQLQAKERRLRQLQLRRRRVAADLADVDRQLAELAGLAVGWSAPGPRGLKAPAPKAAAPAAGRRRRATGRPLVDYLRDVLANAPKGMRVKEAVAAVQKAGYRTHSKDFYGIVATTMRDNFRRVSRGVYARK